MNPIIIENSRIPKLLSWVIDIWAITLYPFIICKGEMDLKHKTHEKIHIKQQEELFVIFFYLIYLYDWIKGLIKYRNKRIAYRFIRFEQEAYENEDDCLYLATRKRYAWLQHRV